MASRARKRREHDDQGNAQTTDTQGGEPSPAAGGAVQIAAGADVSDLLDGLGVPDQAYRLHCRGLGVRAIGARLGIDKDTAQRYVKQVEREMAPRRREAREKLLRGAIARLRGIALEASEQLDALTRETGEHGTDARGAAALLNTRLACEREIARLQGLFDQVVGEGDESVTITISRRTRMTGAAASAVVAAEVMVADEDVEDGAADGD